jgi:outer membrane protein insertion porin family
MAKIWSGMKFHKPLFLFLILGWMRSTSWAAVPAGMVASVTVTGARSVTGEQVLAVTHVRPGDPLDPAAVSDDLKRIWKMGLFSDVQADISPVPEGEALAYRVMERPVIKEIQFFGNKQIGDGDLKDKSGLKEGDMYDQRQVAEAVDKIVKHYREKDFYAAEVRTELKPSATPGKAILRFQVTEGFKMKVRRISVTGNRAFSEARIKGLFKDTREVGWLGFGGSYDREKLEDDLRRVLEGYAREGYLKARLEGHSLEELPDHAREVAEKITHFDEEKRQIEIVFSVQEGPQYQLESLKISGSQLFKPEEIQSHLESRDGKVMNGETWERDLSKVRSLYAEKGYIYADPGAVLSYDDATGRVKASLNVKEGPIAYVEQIKIKGNEITKDRVIRRELLIKEGEAFDTAKIAKSREKVYNLGFFENVGVDTEPGSEMDKQVLVFDVSPERKTGTLSLGMGFSSVEGLVGYLQVSQNNLFGNGQSISAQWEAGNLKNSYSLSFTEPWFLDQPVSLGVDLFNRHLDKLYSNQGYNLDSVGGGLRLNFRLPDPNWHTGLGYRYSSDDYEDIDPSLVSLGLKAGRSNVSSITPSLSRDTRDNVFDASRGSNNVLSVQMAGGYLGGDYNFIKPVLDSSLYFETPAIFGWNWMKAFVLGLHGRVGDGIAFDAGRGTSDVPPAERFFAGGTDTVRGYPDRSLGEKKRVYDASGNPVYNLDGSPAYTYSSSAGGRFLLLTNVEYGFKPVPPLKLRAFYDSGNVWDSIDDIDWNGALNGTNPLFLWPSAGVGFLFTIPGSVIQIRLDWGYPLVQPPTSQQQGRIHFNIGNIF